MSKTTVAGAIQCVITLLGAAALLLTDQSAKVDAGAVMLAVYGLVGFFKAFHTKDATPKVETPKE
jgi:predicted nucleic acid-binding protein